LPNTRVPSRPSLLLSSLRSHRGAIAGWGLGGGAFMVFFGFSYRASIEGYAGGRAAFGAAAEAVADAMLPFSGPAYRLDTYAGYVTYHNVGLLALFLSIYAALQGARMVRGPEESGALQLWLACGLSRTSIVVQRIAAFLAALAVIALLLGVATGLGTVAAGEPDWAGSLVVCAAAALVAGVFYALAAALSGLVRTARTAAGLTAAAATVLFVFANSASRLGPLAGLRFISPYFYFLQLKYAMVPGHAANPSAALVLAAAVLGLGAAAVWIFHRRDIGAALGRFRASGGRRWTVRPHRLGTRSLATFELWQQRLGLGAWFGGVALLEIVYIGVWPPIRDIWRGSELVRALFARTAGASLFDSYTSLILSTTAIAACAYAVVAAGRWVGDATSGREDLLIGAAPISRRRLVLERALALAAGLAVLAAGMVAGLWAGSLAAHEPLNAVGAVRSAADIVLIGLAVGGVGAAIAAYLRSGAALGALSVLLGASYLVSLVQPLFRWPDWTLRFSVFDAFGEPYVTEPEAAGLVVLLGLFAVGMLAAALRAPRGGSSVAQAPGAARPAPPPPPKWTAA
jgi:ABC-type transport system involved in multi-copper enzyme maturation permease subunit